MGKAVPELASLNSPATAGAAPLQGSGPAQPRGGDGSPAASHPAFRPHLIQGWSPDFVSLLVKDTTAARLIDQIVPVAGAVDRFQELASLGTQVYR